MHVLDGRKVGIIGVGAMALAMTERLIAQGATVYGYRRGEMESFVALGARALPNADAVADSADTILLLLPDDAAFHMVVEQITQAPRSSKTIVSLATHGIEAKARARDLAHRRSYRFLEAEISGFPEMIRLGKASIVATGLGAGDEALIDLLQAAVGPVTIFEQFGEATLAKSVINYLAAVNVMAAADALTMAERLGLPAATMLRALEQSAAASKMLTMRGPLIANRDFGSGNLKSFTRFFPALRHALVEDDLPRSTLFELASETFERALAEGHAAHDVACVFDVIGYASATDAAQPDRTSQRPER